MFNQKDRPIGLRKSVGFSANSVENHTLELVTPEPMQTGYNAGLSMGNALERYTHAKETPLFWSCLALSACMYLALVVALPLLIYAIAFAVFIFVAQGLMIGHIRGNCIRVSERQFPEIHQAAAEICQKLNMPVPPIYLMESGGMLNAFATRFLSKDYVVLYTDIVEMAYERGLPAVKFVVAHELAHVQRGHLKRRWMILPALFTLLGKAYYRACEYTCDALAAYCEPAGAVDGLMALSAGKKLHKQANREDFIRQIETESGFWVWLAEIHATHPRLPKRVQAVLAMPEVRHFAIQQANHRLEYSLPDAAAETDLEAKTEPMTAV